MLGLFFGLDTFDVERDVDNDCGLNGGN